MTTQNEMPDEIYLQFSNDGTQIRHWSKNAPVSVSAMKRYIRADLTQPAQLTKTAENVSCDNVTNAGVSKPAGDVQDALDIVWNSLNGDATLKDGIRAVKQLRSLSQQPDAGLLAALMAVKSQAEMLYGDEAKYNLFYIYADQAISRAEQKQKPKCQRCNNTGTWGGVDGHLYDCQDCAEQKGGV